MFPRRIAAGSAMWRLTTLGGLAIERLESPGPPGGADVAAQPAAAQRRPLALLAVLAAAGERGVGRDELLLYFWPDSDVEHARNALRQTLFRLRRDLGPKDPVVGSTELRLDSSVVTSDLAEFEAALGRGELEHAVTLYRGQFLHGVSIGDMPEFDQRVGAERARLAQPALRHGRRVTRAYRRVAGRSRRRHRMVAQARGNRAHEPSRGSWPHDRARGRG